MWQNNPWKPPYQLTMEQLWGDPSVIDFSKLDTIDTVLFINRLAEIVHENARSKGFYDEPVSFPQAIALIHSECSEALEAHRASEVLERIEEELADIVIRVLDTCSYNSYNLGRAIVEKMEKNSKRAHKHGKRY